MQQSQQNNTGGLLAQVPKPNSLRREEDLGDDEEQKLAGLVSGQVGPTGITPKVVQDQRDWADGFVQNANESIKRKQTNFFGENDQNISAHKSAPLNQSPNTQIIDTTNKIAMPKMH